MADLHGMALRNIRWRKKEQSFLIVSVLSSFNTCYGCSDCACMSVWWGAGGGGRKGGGEGGGGAGTARGGRKKITFYQSRSYQSRFY